MSPGPAWSARHRRPASNVLILRNLRDPATPPAGARHLRRAFGDRARMVTADQGGHLAYLFTKNRCANDLATEFLVTAGRGVSGLTTERR
ncbi:alpha/beta hydrolase [Nonomuraea sp. NPDC052116]|uniref:alpha/beta hydrolase n=1 Tax=Nonomuraea sp. NPDC052116 TaxID=3155665 RepID=UPI003421D3D8